MLISSVLKFLWVSFQLGTVEGSVRKPERSKADPLVLSDIHVFNLPRDVEGLLPATKQIAVTIPVPGPEGITNFARVELNSSKGILKLSAESQSFLAVFREGKAVFPSKKGWGSSRFIVPSDYSNAVVEVLEGDFVVMLVGHHDKMVITQPDVIGPLEEVIHNERYELGDYAELFLLELYTPFSFSIVMAEVVRKSTSRTTYCLMKHQQGTNTASSVLGRVGGSFNIESEIGGTFTRNGKYILDWASSSEMDDNLFVPTNDSSLFNAETYTDTDFRSESTIPERQVMHLENASPGRRRCIML